MKPSVGRLRRNRRQACTDFHEHMQHSYMVSSWTGFAMDIVQFVEMCAGGNDVDDESFSKQRTETARTRRRLRPQLMNRVIMRHVQTFSSYQFIYKYK